MIGAVRGRIVAKSPPQLTVEVGGLGYELEAPMSTCTIIPFPARKSGAVDRWSHYVIAAYGVFAILFVLYGTSHYLSAGVRLTLGESMALSLSQVGIE